MTTDGAHNRSNERLKKKTFVYICIMVDYSTRFETHSNSIFTYNNGFHPIVFKCILQSKPKWLVENRKKNP